MEAQLAEGNSGGDPALAAHHWYVAAVMPGREERAESHLRQQGFEPFLPRQRRTVRHARRMTVKRVPFFPGYVFIPLDLTRMRWRSINGTVGVRALICQGERPVACPRGLVERLIEAADPEGVLDFSAGLAVGQQIRIMSGPMADFFGTIERLDGTGRARVLLSVMQGDVSVSLSLKDLAAA